MRKIMFLQEFLQNFKTNITEEWEKFFIKIKLHSSSLLQQN